MFLEFMPHVCQQNLRYHGHVDAHDSDNHKMFIMQEISTSSTYDNDIHDAQHAMKHAVLYHRYNNMATATMLPSALTERLERVVTGRRWMHALIRRPEMRLHIANVHFDPDGRDIW